MEIPEHFQRETIEESFAVLLNSYNSAYAKITDQGRELRELRQDNALLERQVGELTAKVREYESRDQQAALLSALAAGSV